VIVSLAIAVAAGGAASSDRATAGAIESQPASLDEALRAARRLIPSAYRGDVNPWARNPRIVQIASLQPQTPDLPGVPAWRRIGARRCGPVLAGSSWLVAADFPRSRVVEPIGIVFIVKTVAGWRLWYRFQ